MDTAVLRELTRVPGPFVSVYLPSPASWGVLRLQLADQDVDETVLGPLDDAVARGTGLHSRVLVATAGGVLVDQPPSWSPPGPVARVSDLPYLLPVAHRHAARDRAAELVGAGAAGTGPAVDDRSAHDQFVFEIARPGGLAVDGLTHCTRSLREDNADALVVSADRLGDARVWVGGGRWDLVAADDSPRGTGVSFTSERADEALPLAAMAVGADVIVSAAPLPLADGVGVLLRHP